MLKFFRIPFGNTGDRAAVPDAADPSGYVSYTNGYGFDYQRDLATDPAAKPIERNKANQLWFDVTTAIGEIQAQGVPDYITSALNGGSAYSYAAMSMARYSGDVYLSLVAGNTALPTDTTKWAPIPTPRRLQGETYNLAATGGSSDAITGALIPAVSALPTAGSTLIVKLRAGATNTTTTPTFALDALAAKTIVKGNNVPLVAGDIAGAGHWLWLQYDPTLDKWVLLNPALPVSGTPQGAIGARSNLVISASGSGSTLVITADSLMLSNGSGTYKTVTAVNLTVNLANTIGQPLAISTGTWSANTWYYLWVWNNGTTTTATADPSLTSPTAPAGYTGGTRARVGAFRTDNTANKFPLNYSQVDGKARYRPGANVSGYPVLISGVQGSTVTPTWVSAQIASTAPTNGLVPASALIATVLLTQGSNSTSMAAPSNAFDVYNSTTNPPPMVLSNATSSRAHMQADLILQSSNLYYAADNAVNGLYVCGWEDNL